MPVKITARAKTMEEKRTGTYTLALSDVEILTKKAASMGSSSMSAALRSIIREWAQSNTRSNQ